MGVLSIGCVPPFISKKETGCRKSILFPFREAPKTAGPFPADSSYAQRGGKEAPPRSGRLELVGQVCADLIGVFIPAGHMAPCGFLQVQLDVGELNVGGKVLINLVLRIKIEFPGAVATRQVQPVNAAVGAKGIANNGSHGLAVGAAGVGHAEVMGKVFGKGLDIVKLQGDAPLAVAAG